MSVRAKLALQTNVVSAHFTLGCIEQQHLQSIGKNWGERKKETGKVKKRGWRQWVALWGIVNPVKTMDYLKS